MLRLKPLWGQVDTQGVTNANGAGESNCRTVKMGRHFHCDIAASGKLQLGSQVNPPKQSNGQFH